VEEARQHSAVSHEQVAFGAIYFGGLLLIPVGMALQFAVGGRSLQIALLGFIATRVVVCFWRALRPRIVTWSNLSRLLWVFSGFVWVAFGIAISLPIWDYS
jgi:hypothetical protein